MNPDFHALERGWMGAVQRQDTRLLEQLLDNQFVCTSWSSNGELTSREEYLNSVTSAAFGCCDVSIDHLHLNGDTAVVRCTITCDCLLGDRSWHASFLATDVWQRRGDNWKAVSRHASVPVTMWPQLVGTAREQVSGSTRGVARARRKGVR